MHCHKIKRWTWPTLFWRSPGIVKILALGSYFSSVLVFNTCRRNSSSLSLLRVFLSATMIFPWLGTVKGCFFKLSSTSHRLVRYRQRDTAEVFSVFKNKSKPPAREIQIDKILSIIERYADSDSTYSARKQKENDYLTKLWKVIHHEFTKKFVNWKQVKIQSKKKFVKRKCVK